eukprot:1432609-Rhodomonas_salina.6
MGGVVPSRGAAQPPRSTPGTTICYVTACMGLEKLPTLVRPLAISARQTETRRWGAGTDLDDDAVDDARRAGMLPLRALLALRDQHALVSALEHSTETDAAAHD